MRISARKNSHAFPTQDDEKKAMIYNYSPTYTGLKKKSYSEQLYLFDWWNIGTMSIQT